MRGTVITIALAGLIAVGQAPAASANTLPTDCANFGTTLAAAGDGDTIVLSGLCTGADAHFTLPSTTNLTIQGTGSGNDGFDGTGVSSPALTGSDTVGLTVQGLLFENYPSTSAVSIDTTNTFRQFSFVDDTFDNNHATSSDGGGLYLAIHNGDLIYGKCSNIGSPNISLSGSTFTNNTAAGTTSGVTGSEGGGGGALLDLECFGGVSVSSQINVTGNTFADNTVVAAGTNSRHGGGLWIGRGRFGSGDQIRLWQSGNTFDGNSVTGSGGSYAGGGEFVSGAGVSSERDRVINNSLPGATSSGVSSEGAGLSTAGGGTCLPGGLGGVNLVVAGNRIDPPSGTGTGGEGAGIHVGCIGGSGSGLGLYNATVSGNQASGVGAVAGVDGESNDHLQAWNTILIGNSGGADLDGFGASPGANVTAMGSDLCAIGGGAPFPGALNICAPPALVNPWPGAADVHETPASPTIDTGDNSLVQTRTDIDGNPRLAAGRPDNPPVVDMGAVELPSNSFDITKLKGRTLFVYVSWPGTVDVRQAGGGASKAAAMTKKLLNLSTASGGPGTLAVKLRLTGKAKKRLKTHGRVKLPVKVTFSPNGGIPNPDWAHLTIRRAKKKS
jgi:hypothetical protein